MLRARLKDTIDSPGISAILPISESKRLIVAKNNGNIEVYSREYSNYKLFQTYPNILQNLHIDDSHINDLLYADQLSTIFIKCKNAIVLLNSYNLHVYDRIIDKRGISDCWILDTVIPKNHQGDTLSSDDTNSNADIESESDKIKMSFLLYSTKKKSKLRLLVWKGRLYKHKVEISLPHSNEFVKSSNATPTGIVLTTSIGVYLWEYKTKCLIKIQKIVKRKYPHNLVSAIVELRSRCKLNYHHEHEPNSIIGYQNTRAYSGQPVYDTESLTSEVSQLSRRTSFSNFWRHKSDNDIKTFENTRYTFSPNSNSTFVLDGATQNLFELNLENDAVPYMISNNQSQFFEWNPNFDKIEYLSSNILLLYNTKVIRFVDYENGFTFLEETIPEGIREVKKIIGTYLAVWTSNDRILLYHYQVDDETSTLDSTSRVAGVDEMSDEVSICGKYHDSSFYHLWRKVLFYKFFLTSPYAVQLCSSENPEYSLDLCAMKLRDYTVLWCLKIFDSLQRCMDVILNEEKISHNLIKKEMGSDKFDKEYVLKLEEVIIRDIFNHFITSWAPPQFVIIKTFPHEIASLVETITGEEHQCVSNENSKDLNKSIRYEISPALLKKWCTPYLTDIRRNLKNLLANDNNGITWNYYSRSIIEKFEFFLLNNHSPLTIETMLKLLDTVLFKIYVNYLPSMVGPLTRVDNMCDSHIVIEDLKQHNMIQELIDFYYQRGQHTKALEYLTSLVDNAADDNDKEQIRYMVKLLVIYYLQKIPDTFLDNLLHFTTWLVENFGTSESLRKDILQSIFLNDRIVEFKTSHMKIYKFLDKYDKDLSLQYLELVISSGDLDGEYLFVELVRRYLNNIEKSDVKIKIKSILDTTKGYNSASILKILHNFIDRDDVDKELSIENRYFIKFLKTYPLSKMGLHEKSIDILFEEINDYRQASYYCDRIYQKDRKEGGVVLLYLYEKLIDRYLMTMKGKYPKITKDNSLDSQLIDFLKDHSAKLDIFQILKLLPKSVSLHNIKSILMDLVMKNSISRDENNLKKNILQVELINKTQELNTTLSAYIKLGEDYKCIVCGKTFSTLISESVKWLKRDDKDYVVHYNCSKTLGSTKANDGINKLPKTVADVKELRNI